MLSVTRILTTYWSVGAATIEDADVPPTAADVPLTAADDTMAKTVADDGGGKPETAIRKAALRLWLVSLATYAVAVAWSAAEIRKSKVMPLLLEDDCN